MPECDEDSHPREWILFESIDVDGDRILQKSEVEAYFGECATSSHIHAIALLPRHHDSCSFRACFRPPHFCMDTSESALFCLRLCSTASACRSKTGDAKRGRGAV